MCVCVCVFVCVCVCVADAVTQGQIRMKLEELVMTEVSPKIG